MKIFIESKNFTKTYHVNSPELLSKLAADFGLPVEQPCGGNRRCLKCKVIATGALSPLTEQEKKLLTAEEQAACVRFACMATALGDVTLRFPETRENSVLAAVELGELTLAPKGKSYGIAVDIGTTTVASVLYHLQTGEKLATASAVNPQRIFGADVISRIEKYIAGEGDGLAAAIRDCLSAHFQKLAKDSSISLSEVDSMVITGNTAMLYLLTNRNPQSIAMAPFDPDCFFGEYFDGTALTLPIQSSASVYLSRILSAYVGGDIATAITATRLTERTAPTLLVDIGTNGEMAFFDGKQLTCCSTAAGPAFEGAGLYMGMNASSGAIDKVFVKNGEIGFTTIGGAEAVGICGSGIIDAIAVMIACGIVDDTGRICEEEHNYLDSIEELDGQPVFRIPNSKVLITGKDVRAIQLAKAAICAGILTLSKDCAPVEILIAGGFGSYIDPDSARAIGLIPKGIPSRAVGNAALTGAVMLLLNDEVRRNCEATAIGSTTVELSTNPYFMDQYVECMMFE